MRLCIVPLAAALLAVSVKASNEIAVSLSYQEMNTLQSFYNYVKYPDFGLQYNREITSHSSWGMSGHFWMDKGDIDYNNGEKDFLARYYSLSFLLGYDIPFSAFIDIKNQVSTGVTVMQYSWKVDIYGGDMPSYLIGTTDSMKLGPAWNFSFSLAPRFAIGKVLVYLPNIEFLYSIPLGKRIVLPSTYDIIRAGLTFKVGLAVGFVFGN